MIATQQVGYIYIQYFYYNHYYVHTSNLGHTHARAFILHTGSAARLSLLCVGYGVNLIIFYVILKLNRVLAYRYFQYPLRRWRFITRAQRYDLVWCCLPSLCMHICGRRVGKYTCTR